MQRTGVQRHMASSTWFVEWHGEHAAFEIDILPARAVLLASAQTGMKCQFKFGQMLWEQLQDGGTKLVFFIAREEAHAPVGLNAMAYQACWVLLHLACADC